MTWQRIVSNILLCLAHPILAAQSALEIGSEKMLESAREREAVHPTEGTEV